MAFALLPFLPSLVLAVDSVYATDALRALVERAAAANGRVPPALAGYSAAAESELAFVLRESDGTERIAQAEQTGNRTTWTRDGAYEQRVIAYRARAVGPNISALSYMRQAWTVPMLYGNRLSLFFGARPDSGKAGRRRDPTLAIHPFATDRTTYYRFSGGDTVTVIRTAGRMIPVARVITHPVPAVARRTLVFAGEIDVDAERGVIVRMRGRFLVLEPSAGVVSRLRRATIEAVAMAELVNAEIDGRFWLPSYQRIEAQASFVMGGDTRSIFRVITRFRAHEVMLRADSTDTTTVEPAARPHRLIIATGAGNAREPEWSGEPGAFAAAVDGDDFAELMPEQWRPAGAPILRWRPRRAREILRYNRIEGLFTGVGAQLLFRDALPGASLAASAGWAWSEDVARGEATLTLRRAPTEVGLAAGRRLANTNDFRPAFDPGATMSAAFLSIDNYDYVDHRFAELTLRRSFGRRDRMVASVSGGVASDWPVSRHVARGPLGGDPFLPNRGIDGGRYGVGRARLDFAPTVSGEFLESGAGWSLSGEVAGGDLEWVRLESSVRWRRDIAAWTLIGRVDGGMVSSGGRLPPQRLFEIGGAEGLSGYDYKEFAGDRAMLGRGITMYDLGILGTPVRLGRFFLPAPSPALAFGVEAGWTELSSARAADALGALGTTTNGDGEITAVSRPTGRVRASVSAGLRFFGGSVGVAVARPLESGGGWRVVLVSGQL